MRKLSKDKRGFTLIEVIIVLAIIAIISAIVIPNFMTSTESAKIKSDIQSLKSIQNAIDLYIAEYSKEPAIGTDKSTTSVLEELFNKGYINSKEPKPQTETASYNYVSTDRKIILLISSANAHTKLEAMLSDKDKLLITPVAAAQASP